MNEVTDAAEVLKSLIDLLKRCAGLDLTARIDCPKAPGESSQPDFKVELAGPDTPLLLYRDGELLHAIEHVASAMLRLPAEQRDRIAFDADGFRSNRARELERLAADAVRKVRHSLTPYVFPPMNSRERRQVHLALASSGLTSASTGERFSRSVVLYPEGMTPPAELTPIGPLPDDRRSHPRQLRGPNRR